jgi:predicted anti-sigma-YlaC factor YlaD
VHDPGPPYDGHPPSYPTASADEITCQQFVELVTDYFEGALASRTLSQVEEHLVMCDWCETYADQMQTVIATLHELKDQVAAGPPDPLLTALRARNQG